MKTSNRDWKRIQREIEVMRIKERIYSALLMIGITLVIILVSSILKDKEQKQVITETRFSEIEASLSKVDIPIVKDSGMAQDTTTETEFTSTETSIEETTTIEETTEIITQKTTEEITAVEETTEFTTQKCTEEFTEKVEIELEESVTKVEELGSSMQPYVVECTAYVATGNPCKDGTYPVAGVTVAGKKEWLGRKCRLYYCNQDGSQGPLIGTYTFHDTGFGHDPDGDGVGSIQTGERIDLFMDSYEDAIQWGVKKIYLEFLN